MDGHVLAFHKGAGTPCLGEVLEDSLSVGELLGHESRGGKHGEAAVLELLGLHGDELGRVLGLEAEGVEAEVAGDVVGAEEAGLVDGDVAGAHPAPLGAVELDLGNGEDEGRPERSGDLGQVGDGRALDGGIEEEARSLDGLADKESDGGQHGDAAVRELGLAVPLQGVGVGLGSESKGVEDADGGEGARDGVEAEGGDRGRGDGGLLGAEGAEGRGRGGEEGKGGGDLHFVDVCVAVGLSQIGIVSVGKGKAFRTKGFGADLVMMCTLIE
jgi:hypothetical protein